MQWTKKGAHFMLQTRTKVLNGDLKMCFKRWYPNLKNGKGKGKGKTTNKISPTTKAFDSIRPYQ